MTEQSKRIINTYDQCLAAGDNRIAICYMPNGEYRSMIYAHWSVCRYKDGKILVTDPQAHWRDNNHKTFDLYSFNGKGHERKKAALEAAIVWVKEKYGKSDFVRNRMGDYVEREVNEKYPIPKRQRDD